MHLQWRPLVLLVCACASIVSADVSAVEFAATGFGTIGYAISDQEFRYLRYIDNGGTFKADSLLGFQGEATFNPQWSATLQVIASAPRTRDSGYEAKVRWAFASFRPNNEWLFRVGRLRPPVLINTQNAEVGVTYDQARLPTEVYSLSPVYDADGGAFTRTWRLDNAEVNVDAYLGNTDVNFRLQFQPDPAVRAIGREPVNYFPEKITFGGVVVSYSSGPLLLRGGVHRARIRFDQAIPVTYVPIAIPGPSPVGGTLWMDAGRLRNDFNATVLTLGADWHAGDWRLTGEYGRRIENDINLGIDSEAAYVTAAYSIGKWIPYFTYARILSGADARSLYRQVFDTPVPLASGAPPGLHHVLADGLYILDQYSTMLGASYSFSATSKLKFEWMRTKVGLVSAFIDGDVHDKRFNVFTLAYAFSF